MAADWGDDAPPLSRALARRVFGYFVPYWRRGLVVLICIGASAAVGLAPALVTKGVIDYLANPTGGVGPLAQLVAVGVAAALGGGLIGVLRAFLQTSISQGIMFDLRAELFDRLLRQSVGFFTSRRSGDLLSRMSNDVGGIQDVVSETLFGLVSDIVTVASTLALMLALDWRLTLAALILMPIVTGQTTGGTVISVVTILAGRLADSAGSLGNLYVNITGSLALFGRIFQIVDHSTEVTEAPNARTLGRVDGRVRLEHLTFAYPGTSRPALEDVSVEVEPGQLVALVGPSGAGKTTLTYLLAASSIRRSAASTSTGPICATSASSR